MVLEKIQKENDIKTLSKEELEVLRAEIRKLLIETMSETGGHLASNLGVVELTMALHLTFTLPQDRIIWDVGHQAYTHKILTGRREEFGTLRQYGGLGGFPKPEESDCDAVGTGHSSTAISAALGMAHARDLAGEDYSVIAVIGDGAMTGGLAYEALNNASGLPSNFMIVLNDNNMSISENIGGINRCLSGLRTATPYRNLKENIINSLERMPHGDRVVRRIRNAKSSVKQLFVPGMFFEQMGIVYLGPVDGHNIDAMCKMFEEARRVKGPVLVHVLTKKGMGYLPAERHPARFHGTDPYDPDTGLPKHKQEKAHYTDVFGTVMHKLADQNPRVVAVTAAMAEGTGLKRFRNMYPERFFDVGIAEGHAVTFAAGLAKSGLVPVVAIYSTFLQRAYDEILHDVCIQNLPVVFAIDRAGLVGGDGRTHQGVFDLSYLGTIPNLTIMAPKNKWEFSDMINYAVALGAPVAVRYPRGDAYDGLREFRAPMEQGKAEVIYDGGAIDVKHNQEEVDLAEAEANSQAVQPSGVALLAVGSMVQTAVEAREQLLAQGVDVTVVNARFVQPLDTDCIRRLAQTHRLILTMEENVLSGGFGQHVADFVMREGLDVRVAHIAVPDQFIEQGSADELKEKLELDVTGVCNKIRNLLQSTSI